MIARTPSIRNRALAGALVGIAALFSLVSPAAAAPIWKVSSQHGPTDMPACGTAPGQACGEYAIIARNLAFNTTKLTATNATSGAYTIVDQLPPGVVAIGVRPPFAGGEWNCSETSFPTPPGGTVTCSKSNQLFARTASSGLTGVLNLLKRGFAPVLYIEVAVEPGTEGAADNEVTISGGGAAQPATALDPTTFSSKSTPFGLRSIAAGAFDQGIPGGNEVNQAGSHPFEQRFTVDFNLQLTENPELFPDNAPENHGRFTEPAGQVRNIATDLPPGFLGNPQAAAKCPVNKFSVVAIGAFGGFTSCPPATQVGTVNLLLNNASSIIGGDAPNSTADIPLYNIVPPRGATAMLAFAFQGIPVYTEVKVVPSGEPGNPYLLQALIRNSPSVFPARSAEYTVWGVPASPAHDLLRFHPSTNGTASNSYMGASAEHPEAPFLSLPTRCSTAGHTTFEVESWLGDRATGDTPDITQAGCDQLEFEPTIVGGPTTNRADAPSGLDFHLHIPQNEDPSGLATSQMKDAVVTLPGGMTVNPASADGLGACSMAQIGFFPNGAPNANPVTCPDASKIGTVSAHTPVLEEDLEGSVYLAKQGENPFGSLLALYLVLEIPQRHLLIKLAGEVKADPTTGQLTTVFRNNPQFAVEDLEVHLKEGARAPLRTPETCGQYGIGSDLTPWSTPDTPDATPSASFELTAGPSGGECPKGGAEAPNAPSFEAGTLDPTAGGYSPFVLKLTRADATQQLKAIDTTLPKGLLGKLAGVSECPDAALAAAAAHSGLAEKATPSCPSSSAVGVVNVGAGAGSTPLYVQGHAYLAGPYKGAPLSLAIVTPAVAGPFDLGTVVVRTALYVNPETAQIHAVSDPIPTILQGIPLDVRSIAVRMERPQFTLNPTSCNPMSVIGAATSVFDQVASLSNPFQVGDCGRLAFKPKLSLKLKGQTRRGGFPALTATLRMPAGNANIAKAAVTLPPSEFLAQGHLGSSCTRVQYAADGGGGAGCPANTVYGRAIAYSPLLEKPLEGKVYLRSNGGERELPDLVASLGGQIHIDLVGYVDSKNGGIRTTFATAPDAPVSKFVLKMPAGKKGLLENHVDICRGKHKATVQMDAQNGATHDFRPTLKVACRKR